MTPDDRDIEHANARMLDAFRQCDALRLKLAEVEQERDSLVADRLQMEERAANADADVQAYKTTLANMMRMLGRSPNSDLRIAELAVASEVKDVDRLREELAEERAHVARLVHEVDAWEAVVKRGAAWPAERDAAKGRP